MAGDNTAIQPNNTSVDADKVQAVTLDSTKTAGQSAADSESSPSVSKDKMKYGSVHDVPHPHFRWHAEALVDGHEVCQGVVKDISMKGVNFFPDHNLQNAKLIRLKIHIPPLIVTAPHEVIEVTGKITSTVYDSVEDSFRSGISFLEFALDSGREYFLSRIADQ